MNILRNLASIPNTSKSFGLGVLATLAFYVVMFLPAFHGTVIYTYTTEHITEYAIVGLFFWVNAQLLLSFLETRVNAAGTRYDWIPHRHGTESPSNASTLLEHAKSGPRVLQNTMMARRLRSALTFVSERQSADGFREYLNDLASQDAEEIFARYSFPKFVTALLPILGLLGTVVHFGSALSGLSASELAEKIPEIVSGIGTAFNTTCAALTASISTMLIRFLVERRDEGIVLRINSFMENELLHRFTTNANSLSPIYDALSAAQESTLLSMGLYESRRAQEWADRMELLIQQYSKTDQRREEQFGRLIITLDTIQRQNIHELKNVKAEFSNASRLAMDVAEALNADGHLQHLQETLVQNLTVLRQSQQFELAMHELTGAIHLLTARQSHATRAA